MLFRSLRWRVAISYSGLFVVAMAALSIFLSIYIRDSIPREPARPSAGGNPNCCE